MSMTIGRASLATDPTSISQSGDSLTFTINVLESSLAASKAVKLQLDGLEPGEVIPMTWSGDADYDGFYVVEGVNVAPVVTYQQNYLMRAALTVRRAAPGFGLPSWEVITTGVTRTGSVAPTSARSTYAIPAAITTREGNGAYSGPRANSGLFMLSSFDNDFSIAPGPFTETDQYQVPPADFYDAAALVEYKVGSTWYPLVGRQLPEDVASTPANVRVSTGAFRMTYNGSGEMAAEVNASGTWEALDANFEMTQEIGGSVPYDTDTFVPVSVRVVRNDQQVVTVEYKTVYNTAAASAKLTRVVAVTARRGQHYFDILYPAAASSINNVRFGPTANAAATALGSYGLRKTSNDANGNRWVIATHEASASFNTTRGDINDATVAYAYGFNVMLGVELGGSSASGADSAARVCGDWWVAVAEDHRLVV